MLTFSVLLNYSSAKPFSICASLPALSISEARLCSTHSLATSSPRGKVKRFRKIVPTTLLLEFINTLYVGVAATITV